MFGLTRLRTAITTLAASIETLAGTMAEGNARLREGMRLDTTTEEAPSLPAPKRTKALANGEK